MSDGDRPVVAVVDDQERIVEAFAYWLESDYEVRRATGGEEALDAVDEAVDVVLLDRHMPGTSGDEVLDELRERGLDCRVAMVTAVDPELGIADLPFDAYVTKPVDEAELRETVEELLRVASLADHSRELFAVSEKIAALEAEHNPAALADAEEYQRLLDRRADLQAEGAETKLSADDAEAAFRDLDP
ncbi:MAG: response regulator [Haloferacaceae archaeon]